MVNLRQSWELQGQVVVITGGAGLLGVQHAEAVAEMQAIPILLDIDYDKLKLAQQRINDKYKVLPEIYKCDIGNEDEVITVSQYIINKYGKIDVLINNAALNPKMEEGEKNFSRLENFSIQQWDMELKVGLTGALICSKIFGSVMANRSKGVIINIASDLGIIAPNQEIYKIADTAPELQPVKPVTYSVIKHGIIGLTRYIATYWAEHGIRCNALAPGGIENQQSDDFIRKLSSLIPLGRMAKVDEYKAAIVFLASNASSYMNGAVLTVDGGRTCW